MREISAVFKSAREAKAAKKELTEFFKRELELWNLLGYIGKSTPWHQDLEEVNEYVNSLKAQLEILGMGDRMISEVSSSQHGYSATLKYEIYATYEVPKILIAGRTLRVEEGNSFISYKGIEKVKKKLTDKGGVVRERYEPLMREGVEIKCAYCGELIMARDQFRWECREGESFLTSPRCRYFHAFPEPHPLCCWWRFREEQKKKEKVL